MKGLIKKFYDVDTFKLLDFFKWKFLDIYRSFKYRDSLKVHLYGIYCVCGMYGMGKTMTMSKLAIDYRKKYGDKILICSNYGFKYQDFAFNSIEQLTDFYEKPIIFLWDEVQNDFPSSDKNFPRPVRQALTLNRKGNGKMIIWASQDHELVHKTIRRLTITYINVRTLFKRYTRTKYYHALDYQLLFESNDVMERHKIKPFKKWSFIQSDNIRNCYNSFGIDNGEELIKKYV